MWEWFDFFHSLPGRNPGRETLTKDSVGGEMVLCDNELIKGPICTFPLETNMVSCCKQVAVIVPWTRALAVAVAVRQDVTLYPQSGVMSPKNSFSKNVMNVDVTRSTMGVNILLHCSSFVLFSVSLISGCFPFLSVTHDIRRPLHHSCLLVAHLAAFPPEQKFSSPPEQIF